MRVHLQRIARLSDILLAKSAALAARRSERLDQIAEFGVADVSLFWLLHCIHTHWPKLSFLGTHPNQPPERLYEVLATLSRRADDVFHQHVARLRSRRISTRNRTTSSARSKR